MGVPLYEVSTWHHRHWRWCARMKIESLLPDNLPRKMGSRTTRNPHQSTHLCYDYQLRFSQGNFTSSGGKPLPPLQLLYHPVWVIVNLHPEKMLRFMDAKNITESLCCSMIQVSFLSIRFENLFFAFFEIGLTLIVFIVMISSRWI